MVGFIEREHHDDHHGEEECTPSLTGGDGAGLIGAMYLVKQLARCPDTVVRHEGSSIWSLCTTSMLSRSGSTEFALGKNATA